MLENAIDSILKQKISNLEIVIVDDSADNKIQDAINNIEYIELQYHKNATNLGTTLSRLKGIKLSRGEYIGFLDDDDLMMNNNLVVQLKQINEDEIDDLIGRFRKTLDTALKWAHIEGLVK